MFSSNTSDRPLLYHGLTSQQVQLSRHHYGSNVLTPPQTKSWWSLYFDKFSDPVIRVLIIAAIVALVIGIIEAEYAEAFGILIPDSALQKVALNTTSLGLIIKYNCLSS